MLRLKLFVLLGALLLLGMEPLVGRLLLPSFGGSFHVWATCLMFFQGALFLGYLYCHLLAPRLGRWHLLLVLVPLVFLPVGRGLREVNPDPAAPTLAIIGTLFVSIGLPFMLLSTTGVIAQRWLADSDLPGRDDPYQLFAASNLGSLVALLGYPLMVEPFLGLSTQRLVWSAAFLLYVALAFWVAPRRGSSSEPSPVEEESTEEPPPAEPETAIGWRELVTWTLLAAAPSACLLAVTNVIAMDLGSVPMVWVVPLSIYLLTFILIFGPREWYPWWIRRFWPEVVALSMLFWLWESALTWVGALVHLVVLFLVCMVGHGELHRSRPAPRKLTTFYLCVSLGGWVGGIFVSLVAPRVFLSLAEYPVSIGLLVGVLLLARRAEFRAWIKRRPSWEVGGSLLLLLLVLTATLKTHFLDRRNLNPVAIRNFYGIYRVADVTPKRSGKPTRFLLHGTIVHGKELRDERAWGYPIGYFHAYSPLGDVMRERPRPDRPQRVAIVGLGAGALSGHLKKGDELVYYELDPDVEVLAREHFHYLERCPADVSVIHGDARLELRAAEDHSYDIILVDAFSSDAIPIHLLTREAIELYRSKLKAGGLIAFHTSSRYYDLRPVLRATGKVLDPPLVGAFKTKTNSQALARDEDPCKAFVLANDVRDLGFLLGKYDWKLADEADDIITISPWTDDYANILAAWWASRYEGK